jgi:hypothetical protein
LVPRRPSIIEIIRSFLCITEDNDRTISLLDPRIIFHRLGEVLAAVSKSHPEDIDISSYSALPIAVNQKISQNQKSV